jgi:hypothetical protein
MYKFAQISSIFSLSIKIMHPLTAFYCDIIKTAFDKSGIRDPRHNILGPKFSLTYNEKFSIPRSTKSAFLSTFLTAAVFLFIGVLLTLALRGKMRAVKTT